MTNPVFIHMNGTQKNWDTVKSSTQPIHQLQLGLHHFPEIILVIPNSESLGLKLMLVRTRIREHRSATGSKFLAISNVGDAMKKQSNAGAEDEIP